ncbi:hypothetical protein [Nostoc sp. 'Peltigera membranacea cyanobiont' 232]|uniref:hypothetical protein n=1 Tax=Nostoc sp. 'Peltigera membranacea cyanobiont' 232 TaxID=2014531 RepID=UPI000B958D3C|nr:hypothetical protein [Nostoc sp. 'Peltigera membranacea cyanobiont' 232]OYE01041.1 hypothetical protein CDG79_31770 [Nostoc sp. 'Peltigera membranacea cyanobiont' 232]
MTTKRHDLAYPSHVEEMSTNFGLTKREVFAAQILAGLMSRSGETEIDWQTPLAVKLADKLIDELNKSHHYNT